MSRGLRARIGLGLLSVAGMSAGHLLSYWIAAPDDHHRGELLEATGHAGESPFLIIAIAALLATCISVLAGRPRERAPRFVPSFATLVLLQMAAFVGLETIERVTVGASLIDAALQPVFLLGLGTQIVIAALGALVIRTLHVAATTVAMRPVPSVVSYLHFDIAYPAVPSGVSTPWDARGPPHSSTS